MSRNSRHSKILEIITKYDIETQEDLVIQLSRAGFTTTQATISRDIKELGLIKVLSNNGVYKYAYHKENIDGLSQKYVNVFSEAVILTMAVNNLTLIKTLTGSADSILSIVNALNLPESLGAVSGIDTVIIVTRNNELANIVKQKLDELLS